MRDPVANLGPDVLVIIAPGQFLQKLGDRPELDSPLNDFSLDLGQGQHTMAYVWRESGDRTGQFVPGCSIRKRIYGPEAYFCLGATADKLDGRFRLVRVGKLCCRDRHAVRLD